MARVASAPLLLLLPAWATATCIGCYGHRDHRLQPIEEAAVSSHRKALLGSAFAAEVAASAESPSVARASSSPLGAAAGVSLYATTADIPYNPLVRTVAAIQAPSGGSGAYYGSFLILLAVVLLSSIGCFFLRRERNWVAQVATLVSRKELLLKRQRKCTTFWELALPALLAGALIAGTQLGSVNSSDAVKYAPTPVIPFPTFTLINVARNALLQGLGSSISLAPSPGQFLAVTPNTSDTRALIEPIAATLPVNYFATTAEIEQQAIDGAPIYAGIVFDEIPRNGNGAWHYSLRFPSSNVPSLALSSVPSTSFNFDNHAVGLSTLYQQYQSSGFLSLQLSLNLQILANRSVNASIEAPDVFAVPFPTAAYTHSIFYDFAGSLIGLTCVFSLIIPLSTMLRALVVEREDQLRETLFIMGSRPSAYYASIFTTYGTQFILIGLVEAALLGPTIFPHCSSSLVVLTFLLFGCGAVAFGLALSPFFPTARIAALVGPLIFFLTSLLYFLFLDGTTLNQGDVGGKWLSSLFPAMAFYLGASRMAQLEDGDSGVTWSNFTEGPFPFSATLLLQTLDIVLWLALAWYFDQIIPAYGPQRKPWFLCTPSYWGFRAGAAAEGSMASPLIDGKQPPEEDGTAPLALEPLPEPIGDRGVATMRLRKVYGKHVAVHSLDFEARPDEITALLGANGAGKTTTISMLTGLIHPTSGDARIDGLTLSEDMEAIRESLGVCPQVNTTFGTLTPAQHLRMFAALKGFRDEALESAVTDTLEKIGLVERRNTPAKRLSGGQKRKLCLGIALIGQSRTVFLDEPTASMDPHSRRSVWQLLREQRDGRTLVLTTHFLDEAEALSDRIAIVAEGRLRCAGSLLFLKSHFGLGYTLSLVKSSPEAFDLPTVLSYVRGYEKKATVAADGRFQTVIRLPGTSARRLGQLFSDLESRNKGCCGTPPEPAFGILEYGASHTTLEDLFLQINSGALDRLAHLQPIKGEPPPAVATHKSGGCLGCCKAPPDEEMAEEPLRKPSWGPLSPLGAVCAALLAYVALVNKRRLTARRDWVITSLQLFLPVAGVLLSLLLLNIANTLEKTAPRLPLNPYHAFSGITPQPPPILTPELPSSPWPATLRTQDWAPLPIVDLGLSNANNASSRFPAVPQTINNFLIDHASTDVAAGLAVSPILSAAALGSAINAIGDVASPLAAVISAALSNQSLSTVDISNIVAAANVVPDTATVVDELTATSAASLFFNATAVHALPTLVNTLHDGLLRQTTGGASTLSADSQPLPLSNNAKTTLNSFASVFAAIIIVIPFAFVAASFAIPLLRERHSGSKQMQFVSGAHAGSYWLASWTWDAFMYVLVLAFTMIAFFIANRREFTGSSRAVSAVVLIIVDYGFAVLPLSSLASFCFNTPSIGVIVILAFHLVSGFGLVVISFVLQYIVQTSDDTKSLLQGVFCLFPSYCLGQSFFIQSTNQAFNEVTGLAPPSLYSWDQLGRPLTYLLVEGIVFSVLTLLVQQAAGSPALRRLLRRAWCCFREDARGAPTFNALKTGDLTEDAEAAADGEDASVMAERAAVDAGEGEGNALIFNHLRKVYGGGRGRAVTAVKDLCLRVHAGECFGLLGVNGAGKSTTFNMLTGAQAPTSGDATLQGLSVTQKQGEARRQLGYCPQHHALEGRMTARETLAMYLRLRRVPSSAIKEETQALLEELDLVALADRKASTFSGGNKRKLSAAIAFAGEPKLLLLDEPSAGMDAASKRFLWTVVRRRAQGCCTVLTTHSMEEVEALCDRVGVMVGGVLRCVGPIQTLKSTYSKGYNISIRLDPSRADAQKVVDFIKGKFVCEVVDFGPRAVTISVSRGRGGCCGGDGEGSASLSSIFSQTGELKKRLKVDEVSVTQSTLESVFLNMAGAPLS